MAQSACRKVSLKALDAEEPRPSGKEIKILCTLKAGISKEQASKLNKLIRDEGPKGVKSQVMGEELRVSSKSRDHLQVVQQLPQRLGEVWRRRHRGVAVGVEVGLDQPGQPQLAAQRGHFEEERRQLRRALAGDAGDAGDPVDNPKALAGLLAKERRALEARQRELALLGGGGGGVRRGGRSCRQGLGE